MTSQAKTAVAEPDPPWLLRILCFVIPALPSYVVLPGALKSNGAPARMIALVMLGLVVLGFVLIHRTGPRRINPGVVILVGYLTLWLIAYGVGLLGYDGAGLAANRTRAMIALVAHVSVGLFLLVRVSTARQRDVLLAWLAAGLVFTCVVGLLQSVSTLDLRYLFQPPGFVLNTDDLQLAERMGVTRVRGTSEHAIEYSVLAAITIPLTLYFSRHAARSAVRWLARIGCAVAMVALPAAVSRSGMISLMAALLVFMFAFRVRHLAAAVVVAATAIGAYVALFPDVALALWNTVTGSAEDESVTARIDDYAKVSDLVRERPVFGLGLGGTDPAVFGYLDNEWMQAIVQGGLVGLFAMSAVVFGAMFGMAAALRRARTSRDRDQAFLLGAMAIGIAASSFTFDVFAFEQSALVFFLVFAMLWSGYAVPLAETVDDGRLTARLLSSRSHAAH